MRHLFAASAACALLCAAWPAAAYNLPASTSAQLTAALATKAQRGDVIQLAPGNYAVSVTKYARGPITITSQDPARPAALTGGKVTNSAGITFSDLKIDLAPAKDDAGSNAIGMKVTGSKDVHFVRVQVHGDAKGYPYNICGLAFTSSSNVSVEDSEFRDLRVAIQSGASDHVAILRNHFHDLRIDGFDASASSWVTVDSNWFHDFHHLGISGVTPNADHSDAIQFFTAGHPVSMHDLSVINNLMVQGAGAVFQGLQMSDETGVSPFFRVLVSGNAGVGGNWNFIHINNCDWATVSNNIAAALKDGPTVPWVRLERCTNSTETGTLKPVVIDGGAALIAAWKARTN